MISRYVMLGTLILLAVLIVLSAVTVFVLDAIRERRGQGRERKGGRSGKE